MPRKILYEELKQFVALPSYQAFCQYLRNHKTVTTPTHISLKQERIPGKSAEVDYSGDSTEIINPATGQIHGTELFVGSLSYSSYTYAEFTLTQKLEDFIRSHCNMFIYCNYSHFRPSWASASPSLLAACREHASVARSCFSPI